MKNITVGLFGTCDNSKWRNKFMTTYDANGIACFNPDAGDDWHPGLVEIENKMLQTNEIVLFPVLAESLGLGSLGEIGFSVLNSIRNINNGSGQHLITMIDDECTDDRKTETERAHSVKTRKLVKSKLLEVEHPNVLVVSNLADMLDASINLVESINIQKVTRMTYKHR